MARKALHALFDNQPSRQARPGGRARPSLEPLEDRLTPALASTAPLTLSGVAGTVTLSKIRRALSCLPTPPAPAAPACAAPARRGGSGRAARPRRSRRPGGTAAAPRRRPTPPAPAA